MLGNTLIWDTSIKGHLLFKNAYSTVSSFYLIRERERAKYDDLLPQ